MPIYRWLLSDLSLVDLSQDCIDVSIKRGIAKAGSSKFSGKIIPIFRSSLLSVEEQFYSELTISLLQDLKNSGVKFYTLEEYS